MVHVYATILKLILTTTGQNIRKNIRYQHSGCKICTGRIRVNGHIGLPECFIRTVCWMKEKFKKNSSPSTHTSLTAELGATVSNHYCKFPKTDIYTHSHRDWPAVRGWDKSQGLNFFLCFLFFYSFVTQLYLVTLKTPSRWDHVNVHCHYPIISLSVLALWLCFQVWPFGTTINTFDFQSARATHWTNQFFSC